MNNAELFKKVFGIYAEEFWAYQEEKMLDWLTSDAPTASSVEIVRCYACKYNTREDSACNYMVIANGERGKTMSDEEPYKEVE